MLGNGQEEDRLKQAIHERGLENHVFLKGYLTGSALRQVYRSAQVFVLPSWQEGLPYSLLEAMAVGLPVITTSLRGMADIIEEGRNGYLVPPRQPDALADALVKLLVDPVGRARMTKANLKKIKEFSPKRVARDYLLALSSVTEAS